MSSLRPMSCACGLLRRIGDQLRPEVQMLHGHYCCAVYDHGYSSHPPPLFKSEVKVPTEQSSNTEYLLSVWCFTCLNRVSTLALSLSHIFNPLSLYQLNTFMHHILKCSPSKYTVPPFTSSMFTQHLYSRATQLFFIKSSSSKLKIFYKFTEPITPLQLPYAP